MGIEEFQAAMTNRSLRTIKTELEFLADNALITQQQLNTILTQLPSHTLLSAASPPPQEVPTTALNALQLNHTNPYEHEKERAPSTGYYSTTPAVPPPAYPSAPPAPTTLAHATALYQYNPTDTGDLALLPNDRVVVTEYMNSEWWKGHNERTNQEGIFPRSYVKVTEEKLPMVASTSTTTEYGNAPLEVSQGEAQPNKGQEMGKKFGKKLGNAAIFGAGATIGSNIVNGIF
ncbi:protein that induces appearance of [PIN+] prion when overproduced [Coniosporium apollinis]|uniref:Protein that induces appearance of [PIN+] prion when overproduced n=2 Tax=Coniosporium TaxID=2810619 RepID=A0ABQ9NZE7_9PEZI|nr:protein that induces appearance of [PIN+] prion when overproduced [Cladosporium sp. JES 115]KAJ9667730.1 protein that induces appearance of [PIN+] prion when overproduced [Coniosporium apollinis]